MERILFPEIIGPEWVNGYLAKKTGETKSPLLKLATGKQEIEAMLGPGYYSTGVKEIPNSFETSPIAMVNSPNPLTDYTVISFTVPEILRNNVSKLTIYDLQGKVVKTLVNEVLPPGNYISRWDCTNSSDECCIFGNISY